MNLGALVSETRNPATMGLDEMSTLEMVRCFNQEDRKVPEAIERCCRRSRRRSIWPRRR